MVDPDQLAPALIRHADVAVILVDPRGRIRFAREGGVRLFGRHDLAGQEFLNLVSEVDRLTAGAYLESCSSLGTGAGRFLGPIAIGPPQRLRMVEAPQALSRIHLGVMHAPTCATGGYVARPPPGRYAAGFSACPSCPCGGVPRLRSRGRRAVAARTRPVSLLRVARAPCARCSCAR